MEQVKVTGKHLERVELGGGRVTDVEEVVDDARAVGIAERPVVLRGGPLRASARRPATHRRRADVRGHRGALRLRPTRPLRLSHMNSGGNPETDIPLAKGASIHPFDQTSANRSSQVAGHLP